MPITKDEGVTKVVNLNLEGLSREAKARAKEEAKRIILEDIEDYLDSSSTPVSGGSFSKAKVKSGRNAGQQSRLLDTGDLRSSLDARNRKGDAIEVGIFKKSQSPIAFNHNTGDTVPQRQIIPDENQQFKRTIMSKVNEVIEDIREADQEARRPQRVTLEQIADVQRAAGATTTVTTATGSQLFLGSLFDDDFFGEL
jgi:hypothetical protein